MRHKPWYRSATSDEKGDFVGYGERALDDGLDLLACLDIVPAW
jgi:hypothetical protein